MHVGHIAGGASSNETMAAKDISDGCAVCGALGNQAWSFSSSFTDWAYVAAGQRPKEGRLGICAACKRAMGNNPWLWCPPKGSYGWCIHGGEGDRIPSGIEGLRWLEDVPVEPPFVLVLGKWGNRRLWWLRANPVMDKRVMPVVFVPPRSPKIAYTVWLNAERAGALRRALAPYAGKEWSTLFGPVPGGSARIKEIRDQFCCEAEGSADHVLGCLAVARGGPAEVAEEEEGDGEA